MTEGGPTLKPYLLAAGLVDELLLTLNPKLAGGAAALTIVAGRVLVEPAELDLVSLAEGDGDLFTRWRVQSLKNAAETYLCKSISVCKQALSARNWPFTHGHRYETGPSP